MDKKKRYLNIMGLKVSALGNEIVEDVNQKDLKDVTNFLNEKIEQKYDPDVIWIISPCYLD